MHKENEAILYLQNHETKFNEQKAREVEVKANENSKIRNDSKCKTTWHAPCSLLLETLLENGRSPKNPIQLKG